MLDNLEFVEQDKNIAKGKEQIEEWPVYSEVVSPQNDLWESFVVEEHVDGWSVRHLDTFDCTSWLRKLISWLHRLIAKLIARVDCKVDCTIWLTGHTLMAEVSVTWAPQVFQVKDLLATKMAGN